MCAAQSLSAGSGVLVFNSYNPLKSKPVRVFYHLPAGTATNMPMLMVLHGDDRDARSYRDAWVNAANEHGFVVLAPEFSDSAFPGANNYNLLNMFVDGERPSIRTLQPDSIWSTSVLEPIFQRFRQLTGSTFNRYVAFGHSAGSQVLHRYLMFSPTANISTAICANAGWYTLPSSRSNFPYGTGLTALSDTALTRFFDRKVIIQLGQQDINPNSAGLRHNSETDAQGLNRLARGTYYFTFAELQATANRVPFAWRKVEVAGVGHDQRLMAQNAVPLVVEAFRRDYPNSTVEPLAAMVSYGAITVGNLRGGELLEIAVHDATGREVFQYAGNPGTSFQYQLRLNPGLYFTKLNTTFHGGKKLRFTIY